MVKGIQWFFVLAFCLSALVIFSRTGMSINSPRTPEEYVISNERIKILSTIPMIGDLVEKIGGNKIDHTTLIQGNIDPHNYELVKGDIEKIQYADIIFYNGLHLFLIIHF